MIFGSPSIRFAENSELYHECFIAPRFAVCGLGPRSVGAGGDLGGFPTCHHQHQKEHGTTAQQLVFLRLNKEIYIYIYKWKVNMVLVRASTFQHLVFQKRSDFELSGCALGGPPLFCPVAVYNHQLEFKIHP